MFRRWKPAVANSLSPFNNEKNNAEIKWFYILVFYLTRFQFLVITHVLVSLMVITNVLCCSSYKSNFCGYNSVFVIRYHCPFINPHKSIVKPKSGLLQIFILMCLCTFNGFEVVAWDLLLLKKLTFSVTYFFIKMYDRVVNWNSYSTDIFCSLAHKN